MRMSSRWSATELTVDPKAGHVPLEGAGVDTGDGPRRRTPDSLVGRDDRQARRIVVPSLPTGATHACACGRHQGRGAVSCTAWRMLTCHAGWIHRSSVVIMGSIHQTQLPTERRRDEAIKQVRGSRAQGTPPAAPPSKSHAASLRCRALVRATPPKSHARRPVRPRQRQGQVSRGGSAARQRRRYRNSGGWEPRPSSVDLLTGGRVGRNFPPKSPGRISGPKPIHAKNKKVADHARPSTRSRLEHPAMTRFRGGGREGGAKISSKIGLGPEIESGLLGRKFSGPGFGPRN